MNEAITNNIAVRAEATYELEHSAPSQGKFVHSYKIFIENRGDEAVKLLRRHWYIVNGLAEVRQVEGPGVIGVQPVIPPGNIYSYNSWSPMNTEIGKMYGVFTMQRILDKTVFEAKIPSFALNATYILN